jgi:carboxymethylenebutenolidase
MNKIVRQKLIPIGMFVMMVLLSIKAAWAKPNVSKMMALHRHDYPTPTAIASIKPQVPVTTELVEYVNIDGQSIKGYYAHPQDLTTPLPGILAIHEWWGLNDNIKAMARRLAGEGYQVLAVDLYQGQIADTPEQASQLVKQVATNYLGAEANVSKAYDYLAKTKKAPKIGSIGWCFGGSWSLETALLFPEELDATVIYYGGEIGTKTPEELSTLTMPILGIFGEQDTSIPIATVDQFRSSLKKQNKDTKIIVYEDAEHAFANPSGQNYLPKAAEAAWDETLKFLQAHLT